MTATTANLKMKELAELVRLQEELETEISQIKDDLKAHMTELGIDEMLGENGEHCIFRPVISNRFDSTAFKKSEWAELYKQYQKRVETKPFKFYA